MFDSYTFRFLAGANDFGQLGDGTEESRKYPKKVDLLKTEIVKSVSCGANCTATIAEPRVNDGSLSNGRLWVWGQNQVDIFFYGFVLIVVSIYIILKSFFMISELELSSSILGSLCTKYGMIWLHLCLFPVVICATFMLDICLVNNGLLTCTFLNLF